MRLLEVSHGFGLLLPHQAFQLDAVGLPTSNIVPLRTLEELNANVSITNSILPTTQWPTTTILPDGTAGNHYVYAEFNSPIDIESVLNGSPGAVANSNLSGTITVQATDPVTQQTKSVRGRVFIDGYTYAGVPSGTPPLLEWQKWIDVDALGKPVALPVGGAVPGVGFPGTESIGSFPGSSKLISPNTLVFVRDEDGDLTTYETFPAGQQISIRITNGVRAVSGKALLDAGLAASTVGPDTINPEVAQSPPPLSIRCRTSSSSSPSRSSPSRSHRCPRRRRPPWALRSRCSSVRPRRPSPCPSSSSR